MESTGEKIGVGLAIFIAGLFAYAMLPALQGLVMPNSPLLWEPVVSGGQALALIGGIIGVGLLLALANKLRFARATGNPVIPAFVWGVLLGVIAAAIAAFIAIIAFGATYQSMLDLGLNSSAALILGLVVATGTWLILSRT